MAETGRPTCLIAARHPVFDLAECARGVAALPLTLWVREGGEARSVRPTLVRSTAAAPDLRRSDLAGPPSGLWTMRRLAERLGGVIGHPVSTGEAEVLLSAQNLWPEGPLPPVVPPGSPSVGRWCHDVLPLFQAEAGEGADIRFVQEVPLPGGRTLLLAVTPGHERRFAWYEEARYQGRMRAATLADFTRRLREDLTAPAGASSSTTARLALPGPRRHRHDRGRRLLLHLARRLRENASGGSRSAIPVQALCRRHFHRRHELGHHEPPSLEMEHPPRGPWGRPTARCGIAAARNAPGCGRCSGDRLRELVLGATARPADHADPHRPAAAWTRPAPSPRCGTRGPVARGGRPAVEPGPWEDETLPRYLAHAGAGRCRPLRRRGAAGRRPQPRWSPSTARRETRFAWYPRARYRGRVRAATLISFAELLLDEAGRPLCLVVADEAGWKSKRTGRRPGPAARPGRRGRDALPVRLGRRAAPTAP